MRCKCGNVIEPSATGRPRKWCTDCRPARTTVRDGGPSSVVGLPSTPDAEPGPLERAALAELGAVSRVDTLAGAAVLDLARSLDHGLHTGSQRAALHARLLDARRVALEGASRPSDAVDELQQRRRALRGRTA